MTAPDNTATAGDPTPGRPARPDRPVRFEDPARNAAYWARIDRIVAEAPPLSDQQKATIRTAFSTSTAWGNPSTRTSTSTGTPPNTARPGKSREAA